MEYQVKKINEIEEGEIHGLQFKFEDGTQAVIYSRVKAMPKEELTPIETTEINWSTGVTSSGFNTSLEEWHHAQLSQAYKFGELLAKIAKGILAEE